MGVLVMVVKMDSVTIERPYGGQLAEQRKQVRRIALLEAGLEVLGTRGAQATSVRSVCRQAGLSSRYFYESFANLDDLLIAVFDHIMESGINQAINDIPPHNGDLRTTIAAIVNAFAATLEDPRSMRILLVEAWGNEALMRRRSQTLHAGASMLAAVVTTDAAPAPDDRRAEVAAFTIMGGLLENALAWADGALDMPFGHVIHHFTDIAAATMEQALRPPPAS
jgi:AcrR family transcriptional regulator